MDNGTDKDGVQRLISEALENGRVEIERSPPGDGLPQITVYVQYIKGWFNFSSLGRRRKR